MSRITSSLDAGCAAKAYRCWAEISLEAVRANLAAIRAQVPMARVMAVVKANAYGHGTIPLVPSLAEGVDFFGVANLCEARDVARLAPRVPIMLLGAALPGEREEVVRCGFVPVLSSYEEAEAYAALGDGKPVEAHLAIDTGMGRMGVFEREAVEVAQRITSLPGLQITGLCSHLPVADEDDAFTLDQLARIDAVMSVLRAMPALRDACVHLENSAGIIGFPSHARDMVRAGLALYGVSPRPEFQRALWPVMEWKVRILLVREFPAGHGVSYGRSFITPRPMRVATLAVGYADGYPRQISGQGGEVLVAGERRPILGRITMDQMMVDVTGLDVQPGDAVTILGGVGEHRIDAADLARWAGTIPWDIFTGIGNRVVRCPLAGTSPLASR